MIKCEVIKEFTLEKFNELKNIQRRRTNTKGKLYEGDTFECTEEMYKYLTGANEKGVTVVKIVEVKPIKKEFAKSEKIKYNNNKKGGKKNGK